MQLTRGGTELLLAPPHNKQHRLDIPDTTNGHPTDMRALIAYIRRELIVEREELFVEGETVRPGILVLINDGDWELEDELDYKLQDGDHIVFISTLHGG